MKMILSPPLPRESSVLQSIMKRILITLSCFLILTIAVLVFYRGVIFQRGNPLPYFGKMFALKDGNQYSIVFDDEDIYLTRNRNSEHDEMIAHIESIYEVSFIEQMGSTYLFKSEEKSVIASTEIYWSKYLVWELTIVLF